ncbi:MAG: TIGR03619 family F420-dependent LLM class oxidoreductase [Myxococcota bacterium]|nr:TIGR03619 family F420-dependent LLM class oxidoreductase [Myxococcota bacterium]
MQFYIAVAYQDPMHLIPLAQAAEAAGFGGLILSDHLIYPNRLKTPYPYTRDGQPRWSPETPWPDPFVTIGAMAAVTSRLRFLTSIMVLPLRHPVLAAKTIATAAVLSEGRLTLGVGAGWMREEFETVDQPFEGRGQRMLEAIEIMRALWSGKPISHQGTHYAFESVSMSPAPPEPIRIYGGGRSEAALSRVARHFDGWASEIQTLQEIRETADQIQAFRKGTDRENEPLGLCAAARDCIRLDDYKEAAAAGVTELITVPWLFYGDEGQSLEQKCEGIQRFAKEVILPFKETLLR